METKKCKCCGQELPITEFRQTKLGRVNTCKSCMSKHQIQAKIDKKLAAMHTDELEKARTSRLQDFSPRELMKELKRRGYVFTMEYTETHVINSKDL